MFRCCPDERAVSSFLTMFDLEEEFWASGTVPLIGPGCSHSKARPTADSCPRGPQSGPAAPLFVFLALGLNLFNRRRVEDHGKERISSRVLVRVRGPVTNPLACNENGHGAVKLNFHHFTRRRMPMSSKVTEQSARSTTLPRTKAKAHSSSALDRFIGTHVECHRASAPARTAPKNTVGSSMETLEQPFTGDQTI